MSITRNRKEIFLSEKRKYYNQKYETYERKILIGKSKQIVKVVDQTVIKLVGMLKEKVAKSSISTVSS